MSAFVVVIFALLGVFGCVNGQAESSRTPSDLSPIKLHAWQSLRELCDHEVRNTSEFVRLVQEAGLGHGVKLANRCSEPKLLSRSILPDIPTDSELCSFLRNNVNADTPTSDYTRLLVTSSSCWTETKVELDTFTYILIAIISGFFLVTLLATCMYPIHKRKLKKELQNAVVVIKACVVEEPKVPQKNKFLEVFSVQENLHYWTISKIRPGHLYAVDGLRFLSICWVILLFTFLLCPVDVSRELLRTYPGWSIYLILSAHFAADTFFTISALLLCYRTLNGLAQKESILKPFIRRLFKFWPTYAAVIFTSASVIPHFRERNYYLQENAQNCRVYWWTNLLFINNIVHSKSSSACHQETWYLAADMQFYVVALVIVYILWTTNVVGLLAIAVLILGAIACPTALIAVDEDESLLPSPIKLLLQSNLTLEQADEYIDYYIKPWNRAGPYLIGLLGGYLLYELRKRKCVEKPSVTFAVLGWTISTLTALALIYGLQVFNDFDDAVSLGETAIYGGLHSITWSCVIVWIVIACNLGIGGWITAILSWSCFEPLSRLTYCVFLVSTNVQLVFHLVQDGTLPTTLTMTGYFLAHLTASVVVALVVHVLVQVPFVKMGNKVTKSADEKSIEDARRRAPKDRNGIYYTGSEMQSRVNNAYVDENGNAGPSQKRQRPTVRYGMFYDGLKAETVVEMPS